RNHPAGDGTAREAALEFGASHLRNATLRIGEVGEHAGRAGDEDERVGPERSGELARHRVSIDVEEVPAGIAAEAGDDGDVAALPEIAEEGKVEAGDVADQAEVDGIRA